MGVVSVNLPTPLDSLRHCRFSFYPPILNIEHNEWQYRGANWNEIQVMNTKTHAEISVPRRCVGEISRVGEPVMIVGLLKELEYNEGMVVPHVRRVIEMPRAVNGWPRPFVPTPAIGESRPPADVVGIRIESPRESRATRVILGTVAAGLLVCVTVAVAFRDAAPWARSGAQRASLIELPFTPQDGYAAIVQRLGVPASDERRSSDDVPYRRLWYPRLTLVVILMDDRYAGALDSRGRILQSPDPSRLKNLR